MAWTLIIWTLMAGEPREATELHGVRFVSADRCNTAGKLITASIFMASTGDGLELGHECREVAR